MDLEDWGCLGQRLAPAEGSGEEPVAYGMVFVGMRGMRQSTAELPQPFAVISKYSKLVGAFENRRQRNLSGL